MDIEYLNQHICQLLLTIASITTTKLNEKQEELGQCKWTDGESNTDTDFSELACKCAEEAWSIIQEKYPILESIRMVALIPDINCIFFKQEIPIKVSKNKIELKSCKHIIMPGSTISKLDINQPLIYCHRPKKDEKYEVRYGQYHTAMGETNFDLFQDRTPRPHINFTKLESPAEINYIEKQNDDWITHYSKCALHRITHPVSYSWQDTLTKRILFEALQNIETLEDLQKLRDSVRV